jgi:molecular chaperone GrpE (heat shock protein)
MTIEELLANSKTEAFRAGWDAATEEACHLAEEIEALSAQVILLRDELDHARRLALNFEELHTRGERDFDAAHAKGWNEAIDKAVEALEDFATETSKQSRLSCSVAIARVQSLKKGKP